MLVNFIYSLFLIAVFMIPVGIYTLFKFIADNPILAEQPEEFKDIEQQRKGFALVNRDGNDEIFLGLNFLVWIVVYLIFKQLGTISLYALLIIPPILFSLLTYSIRKKTTFTHLEENEVASIVIGRSFLKNFMTMFLINLAGLAVFSVRGLVVTTTLEFGFVPTIMFICLGLYFIILGMVYKAKRFFFVGMLALCCNLLFLFDLSPISTFVIGAGVLALVLLLTGWSGKDEFAKKPK